MDDGSLSEPHPDKLCDDLGVSHISGRLRPHIGNLIAVNTLYDSYPVYGTFKVPPALRRIVCLDACSVSTVCCLMIGILNGLR